MEKIILIGGGGHCKVVTEAILLGKKFEIAGIVDLKSKVGDKILGIQIICDDTGLKDYFFKKIKDCFITLGSIGRPDLRVKLFNMAKKIGFNSPNIFHPTAIVSKYAEFGEGNYVAAGAVINPGVKIGNNCIINTRCVVDHDCSIGDFVHISPGVTLSGGVNIGKFSHVGTGSSVSHSIEIGEKVIIGAGSVVVRNVNDGVVACGNPCRNIRKNAK